MELKRDIVRLHDTVEDFVDVRSGRCNTRKNVTIPEVLPATPPRSPRCRRKNVKQLKNKSVVKNLRSRFETPPKEKDSIKRTTIVVSNVEPDISLEGILENKLHEPTCDDVCDVFEENNDVCEGVRSRDNISYPIETLTKQNSTKRDYKDLALTEHDIDPFYTDRLVNKVAKMTNVSPDLAGHVVNDLDHVVHQLDHVIHGRANFDEGIGHQDSPSHSKGVSPITISSGYESDRDMTHYWEEEVEHKVEQPVRYDSEDSSYLTLTEDNCDDDANGQHLKHQYDDGSTRTDDDKHRVHSGYQFITYPGAQTLPNHPFHRSVGKMPPMGGFSTLPNTRKLKKVTRSMRQIITDLEGYGGKPRVQEVPETPNPSYLTGSSSNHQSDSALCCEHSRLNHCGHCGVGNSPSDMARRSRYNRDGTRRSTLGHRVSHTNNPDTLQPCREGGHPPRSGTHDVTLLNDQFYEECCHENCNKTRGGKNGHHRRVKLSYVEGERSGGSKHSNKSRKNGRYQKWCNLKLKKKSTAPAPLRKSSNTKGGSETSETLKDSPRCEPKLTTFSAIEPHHRITAANKGKGVVRGGNNEGQITPGAEKTMLTTPGNCHQSKQGFAGWKSNLDTSDYETEESLQLSSGNEDSSPSGNSSPVELTGSPSHSSEASSADDGLGSDYVDDEPIYEVIPGDEYLTRMDSPHPPELPARTYLSRKSHISNSVPCIPKQPDLGSSRTLSFTPRAGPLNVNTQGQYLYSALSEKTTGLGHSTQSMSALEQRLLKSNTKTFRVPHLNSNRVFEIQDGHHRYTVDDVLSSLGSLGLENKTSTNSLKLDKNSERILFDRQRQIKETGFFVINEKDSKDNLDNTYLEPTVSCKHLSSPHVTMWNSTLQQVQGTYC